MKTTAKKGFFISLKILSSKFDPAEIRFIQKAFIEERGA
jgi:hypothetical protein